MRAAITASGLPLDRIRYRLKLRDVSVSVPTLSNWQSGRRRPERPESLRALAELENVLDLPPAALRSLLGPPRPRGRAAGPRGSDSRLIRLSHHDTVRVTATSQVTEVRQVLKARAHGPDRWIVVWDSSPATIVPLRHCRLGRYASDSGVTVAELLFDKPLATGETTIIEYRVECVGNEFSRQFHLPTRDYVLEAVFSEMPARCIRTDTGAILTPSPSGSVHLVGLNVSGRLGIRWEMR